MKSYNQALTSLKEIYKMVDSDRGVNSEMTETQTALAFEILLDEIQGEIEYHFETGEWAK
jgi:hypothetical protein